MKILVACEESQRVTEELRRLGHEAYSCDILETSGNHAEWHIMQDVVSLLNGNCKFSDVAGGTHSIDGRWDMIIAFPPCTHLAVSGARHFEKKRKDGRQREGIEFFCKILSADCDRIAIENPVGIMGGGSYLKEYFPDIAEKYGLPKEPTQIIQPYEYGDPAKKTTCLWLKGLNPLEPTEIVEPELKTFICRDGKKVTFSGEYTKGGKERQKNRSKTYMGIAKAMAAQWTREEPVQTVKIGGKKVREYSRIEMAGTFKKLLRSVERQGMEDLLAWLETTDFYTAPASTKYHGAYEGGLLEHSLRVYENLLKRAVGHNLDSIAIVGLLHDICKVDFYTKFTKNQKNENGEWQQVECWGHNNQFPAGHGEKSVMLIMRYIQLTDEEIMAINWHMGGFDARARTDGHSLSDAWAKYPLAVMVHLADMEDTWLAGKGGRTE